MDKESIIRTIIAIGLCVVFFVVWNMFFVTKPDPTTESSVATQNPQDTPIVSPIITATPGLPPLTLHTADYEIGFDNDTGDIRYVSLETYKSEGLAPRFMRIDNKNANYAAFNTGVTSGYIVETTQTADGATVLRFTAESSQLRVTKQYTIREGSYEIPLSITLTNLSDAALSVPVTAQIGTGLGEGFDKQSYAFAGPIIGNKDDNEKKAAEKVKDPISLANPLWGGYTSKYFLFAIMSNAFDNGQIVKQDASAMMQLSTTLTIPAGGSSSIADSKIFVGPKYYNPLNDYGIGIQKTID